jgi:hypothetical protein
MATWTDRLNENRYPFAILSLCLILAGVLWFSTHDLSIEVHNIVVTGRKGWTVRWAGYANFKPRAAQEPGPAILIGPSGAVEMTDEQREAAEEILKNPGPRT